MGDYRGNMAWAMKIENQTSRFYCKSKNMNMGIFFPVAFFRGDLFSVANIRLDGGGLISGEDFSVLFHVGLFSGLGDLFSEVFFLSIFFP